MSKYPENVTSFTPIELKLGIKSSLPNAKQAIVLIYLLWKTNPMQAECVYAVETAADLIPSDGMLDSIRTFLTQNGIAFDSETLSEKIKQNPLFSSQIEHLNVAFELIWKLSHFDFVADMPFSAERSGGKRYAKKILFTTNIDILDATIESNKSEYLRIIYSWLIGENVSESQKKYEKLLTRLLTCFSEDAYFQIRNNASNILFRNYEMYKTILSDSSAILDGEKSNNGPLRILCSSLKEGLNNFVVNVKEDGKNVAKRNDLVSVNDFSAYCCRVGNFLKASNRMIEGIDEDNGTSAEEHETSSFTPTQIIYYGVPGCGKSHQINKKIKSIPDYNKIRTVFHPEYTNADFIGQILPEVCVDTNGHSVVEYKFNPGPFTEIVRRAYLNPDEEFFLVIEEINRGNAAAIFGDMFQLLDRLDADEKPEEVSSEHVYGKDWSSYGVDNPDINAYIRNQLVISSERPEHSSKVNGSGEDANPRLYKSVDIESENVNVTWKEKNGNGFTPKPKHLHFSANTAIRLPPNLSIYATMNTSDQNVFTLDNAFQRRWDMELVPNICKWNDEDHKNQAKSKIGDTDIRWETFRKAINGKISDGDFFNADDKQLGLFFIEAEDDKINGKKFANKVLKYLWADVFKRDTGKIFKSENLSKVVEDFTGADAFDKVFVEDFVQSLKNTNDEIKNHE